MRRRGGGRRRGGALNMIFGSEVSLSKCKHFGRDSVRDKADLYLGQTGPVPGTNQRCPKDEWPFCA